MARMSPELPPHTNLLNIWSHFSLGDSKRSWITCDTGVFSPFCALDKHTYINRKNYAGENFHDHLREEKPQTPRSQNSSQKMMQDETVQACFQWLQSSRNHIFGWGFKKLLGIISYAKIYPCQVATDSCKVIGPHLPNKFCFRASWMLVDLMFLRR